MIESILATVLPIAKDLLITAAVAVAAYAMNLIQQKIQMIWLFVWSVAYGLHFFIYFTFHSTYVSNYFR